jgi:hypothetical protein
MTTSSNIKSTISRDEQTFIMIMHQAAHNLLLDDSLFSNTRPLNYQTYYTLYEGYVNRSFEIVQRMNELRNQEYDLINDQRRLDKERQEIKEKIDGAGGRIIHKEGYKRQKLEQRKDEKWVYFPHSNNTDTQIERSQ